MSEKQIVSARWSTKRANYMTESEWDEFSQYAPYFDISNSELVECALKYEKQLSGRVTLYCFDSNSFASMCHRIDGLAVLKDSLERGLLNRQMRMIAVDAEMVLPKDALIRYYPPYIISIEPSSIMRINIDLSEPVSIHMSDYEFQFETPERQNRLKK